MVQFVRFAKAAKERGARVLLECPHFLLPLLARAPGVDQIISEGVIGNSAEAPKFDVQIPIMSLPGVLGTTLETIPATAPYLFVDETLVVKWAH